MRYMLCLFLFTAAAAFAGENPFPPGFPKRAKEEWREEINAALAKKANFDFDKKPLADVIAAFKAQTKVNFVVDPAAAPKPGAAGPAVTLKLKDSLVSEALKQALKTGELDYVVRDGAVFVHNPKKVDQEMMKSEELTISRMLEGRAERLDFQPTNEPAGELLKQLTEPAEIKMAMEPALQKNPITLDLKNVGLGHAIRWVVRFSGGTIKATTDGMKVIKR